MHGSVPPPKLPPDADDLYTPPPHLLVGQMASVVWSVMRLASTNTDFAWCTVCRKWYRYRTDFNASYIKALFKHCKLEHTVSNGVLTSVKRAEAQTQANQRLEILNQQQQQQMAARQAIAQAQQRQQARAQAQSQAQLNAQVEAHVRSLSNQTQMFAQMEAQRQVTPVQQPVHRKQSIIPDHFFGAPSNLTTSNPQPTKPSASWTSDSHPTQQPAPPPTSSAAPSSIPTPQPRPVMTSTAAAAPLAPSPANIPQTFPNTTTRKPETTAPTSTSVPPNPPAPARSVSLSPANITAMAAQQIATTASRRVSVPAAAPTISKKPSNPSSSAARRMSAMHKTTACEITAPVRKVAERTQQLMFSSTNIFFADAAFQVPTTVEEAMEIMRKGTHDVDKATNRHQDDLYFMSWSHTQFFAAQMAALGFRFLSSNLKKKAVQTSPPRVEDWLRLERYHTVTRRLPAADPSDADIPSPTPAPPLSTTPSTPQIKPKPAIPLTITPAQLPKPAAPSTAKEEKNSSDKSPAGEAKATKTSEAAEPNTVTPAVSSEADRVSTPPRPTPPTQQSPESRQNEVPIIDLT